MKSQKTRLKSSNLFALALLVPLHFALSGINACDDGLDSDDDGDQWTENDGDCDDTDNTTYPGAAETCDGADNNCDGNVDEGYNPVTYYPDVDGDGYGKSGGAVTTCEVLDGYVTASGDCDDSDPDVNPGENESCDSIDNDCDSLVDEGVKTTYYQDRDGDGYGNSSVVTESCTKPDGYSTVGGDCNDGNTATYPSAPETCDGEDNDCDSVVDEGVTTTYYADNDGDGYGNPNVTRSACSQPTGYSKVAGDCNDQDAAVHPGVSDTCSDEVDNDCDGETSEDETTSADTEPNDAVSSAIDLGTLNSTSTSCKTMTGQLLGKTDVDYFKFYSIDELVDNWSISAVLTPPSGQNYCVDMIDDSGVVMDSDCVTGTSQAKAEVTYIPELATGYYWVKIYAGNTTSCATYTVTICGY
jgi:hypothetical protein